MHQPIRWLTGLVPLALVWIVGNLIRTDAIETDLTSRAKAAIATVSANLKDTSSIVVAGRDVTLSGAALTPQRSAEVTSAAESTFGVRKVIAALDTAKPVAGAPKPVLEAADCQAELAATLKKDKIQFELASARLAPAALPLLAEIISIAKRCKSGAIEVAGHTDSSGDPAGNMILSKARSQSVVDYLVRNAIDRARISATGYGDTRPIAPNTTEDGMAQNRRIEFIVK
jgi:OOP family OmpA-OmpF porin